VNAHRAHAFSARFSAGVRGPRVGLSRATRDIFWLFQKRVRDCAGRESQASAMNPTVMALRKGGIRYDSGTDLVRKTLSASASDSGLAQIVQVRVVP
jgi:hypothetical protein